VPRLTRRTGRAETERVVREMWACDEGPLAFMIEPGLSVRITERDEVTEAADLESLL